MADLDLSVLITRSQLGLPTLDINDHDRYMCAPQFLGAMVTWQRTAATSPYLDGEVTVLRTRPNVTENLAVEVDGQADLKANLDELVEAFTQDSFTLTAHTPRGTWSYRCEAADYQGALEGPRLVFGRIQCVFQMPRRPRALSGVL